MKTKTIIEICIVIALCSASFLFGRWYESKQTINYSIKYPARTFQISVNHDTYRYGLNLEEYRGILKGMQAEHSKGIRFVEALLDMSIYDAECRRPQLHGQELKDLDDDLIQVAKYRQQFPRKIEQSTEPSDQFWIAKQKEMDAFLQNLTK